MNSARATLLHLPLSLRLLALGSLAAVLTGCPGGGALDNSGGTGGTSSGGEFCDAAPIFLEKCGGAFCHGSTTPMTRPPDGAINLVLPPEGMTLGQSLLNTPATYPRIEASCPTATPELIIDGTAPAASLLLNKLTGTVGVEFACGEEMPPAPVTLDAAQLDCVTRWVNWVAQTGGI